MRLSTKCSIALHCLVFISEYENKVKVTSELLAKSTGCNSAAIRSILLAFIQILLKNALWEDGFLPFWKSPTEKSARLSRNLWRGSPCSSCWMTIGQGSEQVNTQAVQRAIAQIARQTVSQTAERTVARIVARIAESPKD